MLGEVQHVPMDCKDSREITKKATALCPSFVSQCCSRAGVQTASLCELGASLTALEPDPAAHTQGEQGKLLPSDKSGVTPCSLPCLLTRSVH